MAKFYYTVGIPGSGKDFYYSQIKILEKNIIHISSDAIRQEVYGDVNDQTHNCEVFNIMLDRAKEALKNGQSVYYNSTGLNRKKRINLLKQLPECNKFAIIFAIPFEVCCARNNARDRVVPQYVMERMYKSFEPPHRAEGFSAISYIGVDNKKREKLSDLMHENIDCPHDNPHHSLSCGEHCLKAKREMEKLIMLDKNIDNEDSIWLSMAAKYHDISKFKCKVFYNYKHEPSEIAHYYCHENVSAYDWLCSCVGIYYWENLELVSNLIANHMIFFCNEGAINKRRKLYGEKFWRYLELLHKADVAAH